MQYFGYSVNIIFVIVALLLFQRIFLFHVQFVNGMNTSYVQIRNELASEQLIKVQFQVAMSGRYRSQNQRCLLYSQRRATFKIWGATVIAEIKRSHNKQHKGKQEKLCRTCFFLCLTAFLSYMQNHGWKRAISEP